MILTDINIKIIENEIKRHSNNDLLIHLLHKYKGQELIKFLLCEKDMLNKIPKSIIENSMDDIKQNFKTILSYCRIDDLKLLEVLISCCTDPADIHTLSRKAMLNASLRPELLHKKFPNFFTDVVLLNYSPVVLDEKYILKLDNLLPSINTGFFILQPVTKKLMKRLFKTNNIEGLEHFFKALSKALSEDKGYIEENALKYCIHKIAIKELLLKYKFTTIDQLKIYNIVKDDKELFIEFIKTQPLDSLFVKYMLKKEFIHYYIAHNKSCPDELIIKLYDSEKDLNWLYINTKINISEHINFANHLKETGNAEVIEYNIQLNKDNGNKLSNLRTLEKCNLDKNILYNAFSTKIAELEIGIHMDYKNPNSDENIN